jgi:membrane protein DedA with SNARE-associated domain
MGLDSTLIDAVRSYGAWIVGGAIAIESMGIPFPGETVLISAAVYAGASGKLDIAYVLLAAVAGAIIGDNVGYWVGRTVGFRWVLRHRSKLRLTSRRIKLGQYLFMRHGGKVVFFGRFVAILRTFAGPLAGLNRMMWGRFLLFNALGAIVWAGGFGTAAYLFGDKIATALDDAGVVLGIAAVAGLIAGGIALRRYERQLEDEAERALPGSDLFDAANLPCPSDS